MMFWCSMVAFAGDDVLPERVDDRVVRGSAWRDEGGYRVSTPEVGQGTRVAALVEVPDGGELPVVEARGRSGSVVGPWLALAETFAADTTRVAVVDLGATWDEAELRVSPADDARIGSLGWELLTPTFPDAGAVARSGVMASFAAPLPAELLQIGVVDRASWGARPTGCSAVEDDWYRMAIHHTAGAATTGGTVMGAVQALQAYAQDSGEYCDTPYQFLVGFDGTLWEGRALAYTSGATGGNNDGNIAVCFLGCYHPSSCPNGAGDPATDEMIDGAQLLVRTLVELHGIPSDADSIRGHRDWPDNATACPGDYVYDRLDELRTDLAWYAGAEVARSHPAGVPLVLQPGEQVEVWIDLQNTGGLPWEPGVTQLGTTDPRDGASALVQPTWPSSNRAATVAAELLPGEVGRFAFTLVGGAPGEQTLALGLVHEWVTWFADAPWGGGPGDDLLVLDVVVEPPVTTPGTTTTPSTVPTDATALPDDFVPSASNPRRLELVDGGCGCAAGGLPAGWALVGLCAWIAAARTRHRASSLRDEWGGPPCPPVSIPRWP
jgi:hypothetical protein